MTENIMIIIFGILLIGLGTLNVRGNIESIHWYNRTRITEETRPKYGKLMGIATIIMGGSFTLSAVLDIVVLNKAVFLIAGVGALIGFVIMLYAQIKYNKGIF